MNVLGVISDLIKNLKHRKPAPRVCPACGSPRIRLSSRFDAWLMPTVYVCLDCGYKGPIVMELEKTENADRKKR